MNAVTRFFLSIRTATAIFTVFIVLAFVGSLSLVKNLALFSGIDDTPLFRWLLESGSVRLTWWIYLMIASLGLLAVNTIFCMVNAVLKKATWRNILLRLSPEIMHAGVLFIMLGHLLTASTGFKADFLFARGEKKVVAASSALTVTDMRLRTDEAGYVYDWEADILWQGPGKQTEESVVRPVHPVYFGQYGIYIKSVSAEPALSAQIRVCRDPGALWALIGGLLLAAGGICFLCGRIRSS